MSSGSGSSNWKSEGTGNLCRFSWRFPRLIDLSYIGKFEWKTVYSIYKFTYTIVVSRILSSQSSCDGQS